MIAVEVTVGHETLGATPDETGVNFAVRSAVAHRVDLCLFLADGERRIELPGRTDDIHHGHITGVGPGLRYGFRVHGPWDPESGHRCNPAKLLIDPYARAIDPPPGSLRSLVGHDVDDPKRPDLRDSAPAAPRGVVVSGEFDWEGITPPGRPAADSIIYETHVRGLTRRHPQVPERLRGTYAGLAHPAVVEHLVTLGVTAVELLPVHQFVDDEFLLDRGLRNYWGYNTLGFFAPHAPYAAGDDPVTEFKEMVRALHQAGIEVILDVVYNHTAEGSHLGPTLSLRGLDNRAYYRLDPREPSRYMNWTGTGNTVHLGSPPALQLVTDSLRYWVQEMHVDGFRFDLATTLGRTHHDFDPLGGFFGAVAQDPVLRHAKLIAEPWDVGPAGYRVGRFPRRWSEWNDTFRDAVRDFWRLEEGSLGPFGDALTGSSRLYEESGRKPWASLNFVTSHDGFTLRDLVSYEQRRNHDNGEENGDGHDDNRAWNSGVEGPTDDASVLELRRRRSRSMLLTLLLSQGVPMLLGGDELGRTQGGNNNSYNQDNETSWYDWDDADHELTDFVRRLVALRLGHPTFRRTAWLHEHAAPSHDLVAWLRADGTDMTPALWDEPTEPAVGLHLAGQVVHATEGVVTDDDVLMLFNGSAEELRFRLPRRLTSGTWQVVIDSTDPGRAGEVTDEVAVGGFGATVLARNPR
jgi:isoamylase